MISDIKPEEVMISAIAGLLGDAGHIAVGVLSPVPGAAALLVRARTGAKVSIIGSTLPEFRTDGGVDLFDSAGHGRIDAFFLSGGQIDGKANINLTGIGEYPELDTRWSGAFGSAYLYFVVPKVILFTAEHSPRTLVEKVDFISSPGVSDEGVYRPGGPHALVTPLCVFAFDKEKAQFNLKSVHPGHSLEEVRGQTGFDFACPENVPETELPDNETLHLIRGDVATALANTYPGFARRVFDVSS